MQTSVPSHWWSFLQLPPSAAQKPSMQASVDGQSTSSWQLIGGCGGRHSATAPSHRRPSPQSLSLVHWSGGRQVPAGVYWLRLEPEFGGTIARKDVVEP